MSDFRFDEAVVYDLLRTARQAGSRANLQRVLARAGNGGGLDAGEIAALWYASDLGTETLYDAALAARARHPVELETFSPLYLTNTCDAACRMCGMRADNAALHRETADLTTADDQLRMLVDRGMLAVALLTGEYRGARRSWALRYVNQVLHTTQRMRFSHVLINIGSIDADEFPELLDGLDRQADGAVHANMTMCTFQETYSRRLYAKFMGTDATNPRADYERRLINFDRARDAGLRAANPGVLVGLNPDIAFELVALALHTQHLLAEGMQVYLSVPRLRRVAGSRNGRGATDDEFVRLVALLSIGLPAGKIVLTTREPAPMQHRLVPIITVLSAGSAAVAPYTPTGARFPLESSQFEVIDQRPFESILAEHQSPGGTIVNYAPPSAS